MQTIAMKTTLFAAALSVAAIFAILAADTASASSIVYAKAGNVWRSSPDGRHQKRLTRDGGYSTPSQDDRGRVYAVQRRRFVRLTRGGRHVGAPFSANVGKSGNVTALGPLGGAGVAERQRGSRTGAASSASTRR